jgi:hypothetical protein
MMLPKSDMFVTLRIDGPSMDKRDKHWSMIVHGDGSKRLRMEEDAMSGDLRTWTKYTKSYFINSSIDKYGAASLLFLGQAHVIFAANKTATFRSLNLRRKGLLGFCSTTIPMAGRTPTFSSSNTPIAVIRTRILFILKLSIAATTSTTYEANRPEEDRLFGIPPFE